MSPGHTHYRFLLALSTRFASDQIRQSEEYPQDSCYKQLNFYEQLFRGMGGLHCRFHGADTMPGAGD